MLQRLVYLLHRSLVPPGLHPAGLRRNLLQTKMSHLSPGLWADFNCRLSLELCGCLKLTLLMFENN